MRFLYYLLVIRHYIALSSFGLRSCDTNLDNVACMLGLVLSFGYHQFSSFFGKLHVVP